MVLLQLGRWRICEQYMHVPTWVLRYPPNLSALPCGSMSQLGVGQDLGGWSDLMLGLLRGVDVNSVFQAQDTRGY